MAIFNPYTTVGIFNLLLCALVSASSVVVDSPFGKIRGEIVAGDSSDKSHVVFRNIPYAKPPVGDLRFAKTEPHPKLDGVFDATDKRMVLCVHPVAMLNGQEQGSEDCLILNIFAKDVTPGKTLKKVMVFIHGGGFTSGTSSFYNMGTFVSTHDVIGVTINYRLGILGFMSTGNEASLGNYGLWDQATALKWVKDHIEAFGGDPNDITLAGESAGGMSVAYNAISPVTKGLFTKGVIQSGTATSVYISPRDAQRHTLIIAKLFNCTEKEATDELNLQQSEVVVECLRHVDIPALSAYMSPPLSEAKFIPVEDGIFLTGNPGSLLKDESFLKSIGFYDRSYIVSIVNNEFGIMKYFYELVIGMIRVNDKMTDEQKQQVIAMHTTQMKNFLLKSRLSTENADLDPVVEKVVMDFYNRRHLEDDAPIEMLTDVTFLLASYDFLNAASKHGKCKSWFLYFDYFPGFLTGNYKGTVHGFDLLYLFDASLADVKKVFDIGIDGEIDDGDVQLKSMYSSLIAHFMKDGEPGVSLKEHLPSGWPVYDVTNSNYLNFNLQPTVRSHLEREKRDLWLKTIPKLMEKSHEHTEL